MQRRQFLLRTAAVAALPTIASGAPASDGLIDTNVWLGHWPIRRSWADSPTKLVARLRSHGVTSAWAGSFDAALHTDIAGVNARLAEVCAREGGGLLVPFGTVNPALPDWEDDLRRCAEVHKMPGVRLLPNYHGYALDDARFARLLDLATQRGLLVQIALTMEDDRSQNPAFAAAPVVPAPLADLVEKNRAARVMLLNATSRLLAASNPLLKRLSAAGVLVETATLEGAAGIEGLLKAVPGLRLAFGSHTPYFYFEAALLKLQESALTAEQLTAIRSGHARAALARTP
ncbi:MAG: amidohydrolase family protein [Verrucomicrobia bacterium]|nr:amidohydrolase family protein [Verrucomicrobiota bacterium]